MDNKEKGKNWVNYQEIKSKVTLAMVLEHYQIALSKSGNNYTACCPIHKGSNPKQFSVNMERNIWKCFGDCQKGGNVLDFVSAMENGISIHESALKLKNWFFAGDTVDTKATDQPPGQTKVKKAGSELVRKEKQTLVNQPLPFALKKLDKSHPFFAREGIKPETVEHFGLGYCNQGMMKNRIVIPIHDHQGQLIAYCGRALDEELIKAEGKYKLPSSEKGFYKSHVLYNLHRQTKPTQLILVESFKSVWKFHQHGQANVITPLGSSVSDEQAELLGEILGSSGVLIIIFDADEAGQTGASNALLKLAGKIFVKVIDISPYALKPHHLSAEQIKEILT